jgi:hypothetical protein
VLLSFVGDEVDLSALFLSSSEESCGLFVGNESVCGAVEQGDGERKRRSRERRALHGYFRIRTSE